jgi:hypothetical protein
VTGDSVPVDTALIGAVTVGVGVTAGVLGIDVADTERMFEDELPEGSEAGTTVVVEVEVQSRPWHGVALEPEVEDPFTAGRPFTVGVVALVCTVVGGVVDVLVVVVVPGVVVDGSVVVVDVSVVVPVTPAPRFVVVPVGVVPGVVGVGVGVAGVAGGGVVSLWVLLAGDVVAAVGVAGCGVVAVWVVVGAGVAAAAGASVAAAAGASVAAGAGAGAGVAAWCDFGVIASTSCSGLRWASATPSWRSTRRW